ncbi:hypothetical protein DOTSEDRAFT_27825 [Dothistroma septosporum NZE10]|uniref:Myb-like domain-containing protein n=1 Tax=Dothistroma septosporum (strain NZE10 / CBS 128990) TaxID=675120 RepID=N1PBY3_DOTSN|nr:hypothetical protein DOTSEDRAFT_27825 [Dothistroma septosporum NZE10]
MSGLNQALGHKRARADNLDIDATAALGGRQADPAPKNAPRQDSWGPDYSQMPANSVVHKKDPFGREQYQKDLREYHLKRQIPGVAPEYWPILRPEPFGDDGTVRICVGNPYISPSEVQAILRSEQWAGIGEQTLLDSDGETATNSDGEEAAFGDCVDALMALKNSAAPMHIEAEDLEAAEILASLKDKQIQPESRRPAKKSKKAPTRMTAREPGKPLHIKRDSAQADNDADYKPEVAKASRASEKKPPKDAPASRALAIAKGKGKPTSEQVDSLDSAIHPAQNLECNFREDTLWVDEDYEMFLKLRWDLEWKPWKTVLQVLGRSDQACRLKQMDFKKAKSKDEQKTRETASKRSAKLLTRLCPWSYEDEQLLKRLIQGRAGKTWTFEEVAEGVVLSRPRSVLACQLRYRYVMHPKYDGRPSLTSQENIATRPSRQPTASSKNDGKAWDSDPLTVAPAKRRSGGRLSVAAEKTA